MSGLGYIYFMLKKELQIKKEKMDDERYKRSLRLRILRDRFSKHSIPNKEFEYKYRLNKELFDKLHEELRPLLKPNKRLDNGMKILLALNFFAWGRYQGSVAHKFNISYRTVSQCIVEVSEALFNKSIYNKYVKFPKTKEERDIIKKEFDYKFGIPDVIGCIACTHVAIIKPSAKPENYLNSFEYYSFNAEIVCDAYGNILYVNPTYGGACQEWDIWYGSRIEEHLNGLQETAYILGNTMYPQEKHLMIPIVEEEDLPEDCPKSRYNKIHKNAYSVTFKTISQLKARWRCLLALKELHYDHTRAAKIFYSCCVLHNLCNTIGLEAPELSQYDMEEEAKRQNEVDPYPEGYIEEEAAKARDSLVQLLEDKRSEKNKLFETTNQKD